MEISPSGTLLEVVRVERKPGRPDDEEENSTEETAKDDALNRGSNFGSRLLDLI